VFNQEVVVQFPASARDFSFSDLCRQAQGPKQPLTCQVLLEDKGARASSNSSQWAKTSSFTRFLDHTQRRTAVGRTPLDEWSARRRDLYLTTHNNHNRQISMPRPGIRNQNLSRRASADQRLRPRDHWDRQNKQSVKLYLQALLCPHGRHRTS